MTVKNVLLTLGLILLGSSARVLSTPVGYAVLVGVVHAGKAEYDDRATAGCANDIADMYQLLLSRGFLKENIIQLTTDEQTRPAIILKKLAMQICKAKKDDLFVFYFTGHGTQKEDTSIPPDEDDGLDEYLVGFKGDICDDQLASIWQQADRAARLVVILDACHSGRIPRLALALQPAGQLPEVPVSAYTSIAEETYRGARSSASARRRGSSARQTVATHRLSSCLFETIDPATTYQMIYLGAIVDEESAIAFPNGRGEFTSKLIGLIHRFPALTYRQLAHDLLANETACSNQAAYAEIGTLSSLFLQSLVLLP